MARCDQGYLCDVCGEEVANITESDLYLHYIIGEVDGRALLAAPERHIRCNPSEAQFIVAAEFPAVNVEGPFAKQNLDESSVAKREELLTRGWKRLQEVKALGLPISEYPLPEVIEQRNRRS